MSPVFRELCILFLLIYKERQMQHLQIRVYRMILLVTSFADPQTVSVIDRFYNCIFDFETVKILCKHVSYKEMAK
jgi:hypothetical protein